MIGSDTANDVAPQQYEGMENPVHLEGVTAMACGLSTTAISKPCTRPAKRNSAGPSS